MYDILLRNTYYREVTLCIQATINSLSATLALSTVVGHFCAPKSTPVVASSYGFRSFTLSAILRLFCSINLASSSLLYHSCLLLPAFFPCLVFVLHILSSFFRFTVLTFFVFLTFSLFFVFDPFVPLFLSPSICLEFSFLPRLLASSIFFLLFCFSLFRLLSRFFLSLRT